MKTVKLVNHQNTYSDESLVLNQKDFPHLKIGDIVEIYQPEDSYSRLLLQINSFREDFQQKESISVEQTISSTFQLRIYTDVIVNKVNPKDVALDSLELTFKDQYLGRSDMWRLKKCLINTCVVIQKQISIFDMRCQVFEMWAHGERVAGGVVTEDTKIVYRSASSMFYLFIQLSSEMWDFDINGDLYIEKAVNGFLADLFSKWKKLKCTHDVTIVLFSRTFYNAQKIEEFPKYMHECLFKDHRDRFYEDYYRVAVQNERFEDWNSSLILLKKMINQYQETVLNYHKQPGITIPPAYNSTAAEGNFLEVLNMSLNVFEKHFMERSFDRTGQLSVVISPGVGVFEVDRELANITKQRTIDNGIGSDLVCLGEQPFHAVPLFKFHNRHQDSFQPLADDYNMPHWINLSFYSSQKQISYCNFLPRIRRPSPTRLDGRKRNIISTHPGIPFPSFCTSYDYDEYDAQVLKFSQSQTTRPSSSQQNISRKKGTPPTVASAPKPSHRRLSDDFHLLHSDPIAIAPQHQSYTPSAAIAIPGSVDVLSPTLLSTSLGSRRSKVFNEFEPRRRISEQEVTTPPRSIASSSSPYDQSIYKSKPRKSRALINPFDPSRVTIKLTSNRRRWTHVFPLGPTGIFMQQHHYQAIPHTQATLLPTQKLLQAQQAMERPLKYRLPPDHPDFFVESTNWQRHLTDPKYQQPTALPTSASSASLSSSIDSKGTTRSRGGLQRNISYWSATGEQEWTPAITTGVDWKSLVIPACLPITTDYFPDEKTLDYSSVIDDYCLSTDVMGLDILQHRCYKGKEDVKHHRLLTTEEAFMELVCQRLQQGFQIIISADKTPTHTETEYHMSIGRIFHKLSLLTDNKSIQVTSYRPKYTDPVSTKYHYCYRFHAPNSLTYGVSFVNFAGENLANYHWNHLDHYISARGHGDFGLKDGLKFWRLRLLLLPGLNPATKQIIEDSSNSYCDIYSFMTQENENQQRDGFIKVMESLNRIRRPNNTRSKAKPNIPIPNNRRFSLGHTLSNPNIPGHSSSSAFRQRVGSNRVHDRPRLKSIALSKSRAQEGDRSSPSIATTEHSGSSTSLEGVQEGVSSSTEDFQQGIQSGEAASNLTITTPIVEVLEAMRHPSDGLLFLPKQSGLPNYTFLSMEAVIWVKERIPELEDEYQAFQYLEKVHADGYIIHASGLPQTPFINGFYMYYLIPSQATPTSVESDFDFAKKSEEYKAFSKEWFQVEIPLWQYDSYSTWRPCSFKEELGFKQSDLEIDIGGKKSDRMEWGHIRYHNHFQPGEAFEILLEWMVATGNRVAELVQVWARKATSSSLHLVPIPSDPFALPFHFRSDPLRGPIFIHLSVEILPEFSTYVTNDEELLKFQESILARFGFIYHNDPTMAQDRHQYTHISGSMFILILGKNAQTRSKRSSSTPPSSLLDVQASTLHEDYITRHFSGLIMSESSARASSSNTKVGYLWAWNYMITKRWKTAATGDEKFMRKVMSDFRAFCSNSEDRLIDFWNKVYVDRDISF